LSAESKFLASGREDVDVRTLGRGRPFAVELPNPHHTILTAAELANLQKAINEGAKGFVEVRDLQLINKLELLIFELSDISLFLFIHFQRRA
jgi:tRNA pseudouridine synthase 10